MNKVDVKDSRLIPRSVFRSMISMSTSNTQRDPIVFTAETIGHSGTVKALLGVLYHSDMSFIADSIRTHFLIELVEKWDFAHVRKLVHGHVSDRKQSVIGRFELSLQLKDPHLATSFFRSRLRSQSLGWYASL